MSLESLSGNRLWGLADLLPFWILNILGEAFLRRGVMMPRQEIAFGKSTWLIHGFGWRLFHVVLGCHRMINLIPITCSQSWVVQKTKNS